MFALHKWFACFLLVFATFLVGLKLLAHAAAEKQPDEQLQQELKPDEAYTQYREGVRRDVYEGKQLLRKHAFYSAAKAQMVWQETTGEFEERLTDCAGCFETQTGRLHIRSPHAVVNSRPMTLVLSEAECVRLQKAHPSHCTMTAQKAILHFPDEKPWTFEAQMVKMCMRQP